MAIANCLLCEMDDEEEFFNKTKDTKNLKEYLLALPNGTSTAVSRFFTGGVDVPDIQAYRNIVMLFVDHKLELDREQSAAISSEMREFFEEDGNMGMIKRLVPIMTWRKLRTISKIYQAIPLSKLAIKLGMGETQCSEFLIKVAMKQNGNEWVRAPIELTIDEESRVVYFDVEEKEEDLEKKIGQCMDLAKRVKQLDVGLASTPKYLAYLVNNDTSKKSNTGPNMRSVADIP